jgi:hypothetical protein
MQRNESRDNLLLVVAFAFQSLALIMLVHNIALATLKPAKTARFELED